MYISKITPISYYGNNAAMVKKAATKENGAFDFIKNALKPAEDFVNYDLSSYSVPTGDFPMKHANPKRHHFFCEDSVVESKYLVEKKESKPAEEVIDFVSESYIK